MATMLSQKLVEAQEANDTVRDFMRRFEVGKLLSSCRAQKTKGFSVVELFVYMVCCMFSPISTYMSMRIGSYREAFCKNTLYRFCGSAGINWHKSVQLLSEKIISGFIRPATSDRRIEYFIFDDTPFAKSGKKTELVSKFFNHVTMKTVCMNVFLEHLSKSYPDDYIVLVCDGAAWHKSGTLKAFPNVELMFIPPYTPEMNPIEQIWKELRARGFHNEVFQTLENVVDRLCDTICNLTAETIRSITGRSWIVGCFN